MGESVRFFISVHTLSMLLLLILTVAPTSSFLIQYPYRNIRIGPTTAKTTSASEGGVGGVANKICSLPPLKPGAVTCIASIPKFTFNSETGACEEIIYGGCNGTQNLFNSIQLCKQTCETTHSS